MLLSKHIHNESWPGFRLKPSALWRHYKTCISNIKNFFQESWMHAKCSDTINCTSSLKFFHSLDTSYKIHSFIASDVCDVKNVSENVVWHHLSIQAVHWVLIVNTFLFYLTFVPSRVDVQISLTFYFRAPWGILWEWSYVVILWNLVNELLWGHTIYALKNSVVIHNFELRWGEDKSHEVVERFFSCYF